MKRVTVSHLELLRDLLPHELLSEERRRLISRCLATASDDEIRETAQWVLRALLAEGKLDVTERIPEKTGVRLRLRDPLGRFHLSIVMDEPQGSEGCEYIPLPLDAAEETAGLPGSDLMRELLADEAALVQSDRVAHPRELVTRLETTMRDALAAESLTFFPYDQPPGEFWGGGQPVGPALEDSILRDLSRSRSQMLFVRSFASMDPLLLSRPRMGSALYIGIGDEIGGWRGVIEILDHRPGAFTKERTALAYLLAQHFQTLMTSSVRLQSLIFLDFLTGLYNRPYFEDQLDKQVAIAHRRKQSLALCIVDIDGFKGFNTRYGYEGGDRALVTVACILKSVLRTSDTLARYGGEEFAALLVPPVGSDRAHLIAERLRAAVETEPFQVQSLNGDFIPERITVSVGGALYPDHAQGARELWTAANRMLLMAKDTGKNRVLFVGDEP